MTILVFVLTCGPATNPTELKKVKSGCEIQHDGCNWPEWNPFPVTTVGEF